MSELLGNRSAIRNDIDVLTVLIATHNGEDTLERTLSAFAELVSPPGGWKLVIVDNASSDRTPKIITSWIDRLPIDSIFEARMGKASALNTGISRVAGDFVVFADDDVLPDPNWLVEWRRVADRYPDCDVFGGTIVPDFETPPPMWLIDPSWLVVLFAATRPGPEGLVASGPLDVFGPNMGVRTSVFACGLRFREEFMVGPAGLMGEETDFVDRALRAGHNVGFAPTASVRHIVQRNQVTWRWMLHRFYRHGQAMFFTGGASSSMPRIGGVPRYLVRRLITRSLTLPVVALSFNLPRIFAQLRLMAYDLGAARQSLLRCDDSQMAVNRLDRGQSRRQSRW